MNKQMDLFAEGGLSDDGMSVDPVSGNEVPSGSMAEEVRDDIPAQLSEGEYVVPADVVRYYGVKFFEDLRNEAKMGLTDMEANGRIGGEPIGDEEMDDLDAILMQFAEEGSLNIQEEEEEQGYAVGGIVEPMGGEPTGADALVEKVMAAVQTNPAMQQELASKGIQVNRTTPQMQPEQMDQNNPPEGSTQGFAEGGLSLPTIDPFSTTTIPDQFSVLGGSYFEPTPTATTQPVKPTCPPGQVYDEQKKMCVPVQQQAPQGGGDDGGSNIVPQPAVEGEEGVGFGDWAKEVDWSNPSDWVDENLSGLGEWQEKGAKAASALVGGPLGLVASALPAATDLRNVAKMKAMQQVYQAAGMEAEASMLADKLESYIKDSPKIVDFVDDIVATGKGEYKNVLKSLGLDENETNADVIRAAVKGSSSKPAPKSADKPQPKDSGGRNTEDFQKKIKENAAKEAAAKKTKPVETAGASNKYVGRTDSSGKKAGDVEYKSALKERQEAKQKEEEKKKPSGGGGRYKGGLMTKKKIKK